MRKLEVSFKRWQFLLLVVLGSLSVLGFAQRELLADERAASESSHTYVVQDALDVYGWFNRYDAIRRHSRMSLREKFQSRHLFMLVFNPMALFSGEATPLLQRMIEKYDWAIGQMEELKPPKEAAELHEGYLHYFKDARSLFADICEAEKKNSDERRKILPDLMSRKRDLEKLDQENKQTDARLRRKYDIAPLKG
jgi:hypothetical protein